jgi:hypothetical protein
VALTAMWTHGNAVIPEIPERLEKITRFGFGTELKVRPNVGTQWVHVPMTSPVLLAGARPKLRRVLILSKSSSTVHQSFDGVIFLTATIVCRNFFIQKPLAPISPVLKCTTWASSRSLRRSGFQCSSPVPVNRTRSSSQGSEPIGSDIARARATLGE